MKLKSKNRLQHYVQNCIFLILLLSLFISSCNTMSLDYDRHEYIKGTYYPNNTVKIEVRPVTSPKELKILTISQPIPVNELGNIRIIMNWGSTDQIRKYMKSMNPPFADWAYDVVMSDIPGYGKFYIPVYVLKQNGRLEYKTRNLSFFEWIQYHPILSTFFLIVILISIIITQIHSYKNQKALRIKKQQEVDEKRLQNIKDDELKKEREIERRKDVVLEIVNILYKETAREVRKTSNSKLIKELQDILDLLNSDKLNDALFDSNITSFQNQIGFIKSELNRIKKFAGDENKRNID